MIMSKPITVLRDPEKLRNCRGEKEYYYDIRDHWDLLRNAQDHKGTVRITWGVSWQSWDVQKNKANQGFPWRIWSPTNNTRYLWTQFYHYEFHLMTMLLTMHKNYPYALKSYRKPMTTTVILDHQTAVRTTTRLSNTGRFLWLLGGNCEHLEKIIIMWTTQYNLVSLSTNKEYPGLIWGVQLLQYFPQGHQNPKRITSECPR